MTGLEAPAYDFKKEEILSDDTQMIPEVQRYRQINQC